MSDEEEKKERQVSARDVTKFAMHYWGPNKVYGIAAAVFMLASVSMDAIVPV